MEVDDNGNTSDKKEALSKPRLMKAEDFERLKNFTRPFEEQQRMAMVAEANGSGDDGEG
jgi:hypothetical protein